MRLLLSLLRAVENTGSAIAAVVVFVVMALGVAEIVARGAFNAPIPGHVDIVVVLMPLIVFLGIATCLRRDEHIRMTLLLNPLPPRLRAVFEFTGALVGAATSFALAFGAYQHFERALQFGDSTPDLELLTWPFKLAVAGALVVLGIRFLIFAAGHLGEALGRAPRPELTPEPRRHEPHLDG